MKSLSTHGLTHISLAVRDPDVSAAFYTAVFGYEEYYRDSSNIQVKREWDVLAFERDRRRAGKTGGVRHFGFRLTKPADIDSAIDRVVAAGGKLLDRGEHGPGYPYAYISDPDGYEIEIWFE